MKLLIVDDHSLIRRTVRELLATSHDDVQEASNGAEAVTLYERQLPDWVIMDLQMKPVGGLAATRRIIARHPEARIIIFSQYDEADLRISAQEAGATAYVTKDNLFALPDFIHSTSA
ncbi:MAG TPA: response regulator transcription factor [Candidatus Limnocylindria bacterium]|jgi:two-component system response regulator DegU|nr:response regulator transcription factor [Candidatus Limnocylindria bacterium]